MSEDPNESVGRVAIRIVVDVTRQMVDDIMITAFEGGINYWCTGIERDFPATGPAIEEISRGGRISIESDEGKHQLDLAAFLDGLMLACERRRMTPAEFHENHDAEMADEVIQFALFGEIVFG